ncbi:MULTISPECIES: LacI family transcriptional regulator [unclassified Devosia]|uniref:LacI family transcriptional regulator n=1 Tax=unclassified Devosia TaxID=196773 RepID=UPI00145EF509|nr:MULTISPECIES: LacI family transcriptional regulator [unclassified Devosia]MBJ6985791.1 LacI family DNA-binding transcriptional regulator [Devosia sp. MC521]QMW61171.1 LacI family DNA-binding transcriptional regulator [Devosia sp. MC521]
MAPRKPTTPPQSASRVTLKTIAEMTGLSLSTVSLSLRDGSKLKQETRDKVAEAAKALGYVPDRAGVRLRTGKTNVIALVLDSAEDSIDFARQMIQGIGQGIRGTRYHLTVIPEFERSNSDETIRYVLENRTADGVIITHTRPRDRRVQMMMDANFPFVSHGRTEFYAPHPYHDFDSHSFTVMAVERLVAKGCRCIRLAMGDDRTTYFHTVQTAFLQATAKAGVEAFVHESLMGRSPNETRAIGSALAKECKTPFGIICDSEMRTIALVGGMQEAGAVMGRDFHVVYKQTSGILPAFFPNMDSLREDVFSAGQELTRILLERINGEKPSQLQTLASPQPHWRPQPAEDLSTHDPL